MPKPDKQAPETDDRDPNTPEPETEEGDEPETEEDQPEGDEPEPAAEDEEPEPGAEPVAPAGEEPAKPVRQTRESRRIQRLLERTKAAETAAEEATRAANEIRAANQGRQTEEARRIEQERLALMSPEEAFDYKLKKQAEESDRKFGLLQFQMQDASDRTAFESLCARKPHFADLSDEVERELATLRRTTGTTAPRQTIALYLLGRHADERAAGAKTRQGKKGQEAVRHQTSTPGSTRSDVGQGAGKRLTEAQARLKRLEGMTF